MTEKIGGERDVVQEGLKNYKQYSEAIKKKDIDNQLKYAIELENIIGRFRANSASSVKLSGSQELKDAIALIDNAQVSKDVKDEYKKSTKDYEDMRTSWRYLLSATVCGFDAQNTLEFSEP